MPFIDFMNEILWSHVLVYALIGLGIYLTVRLGFLQFTHVGEMFRAVVGTDAKDKAGISPFQALTVSLASRIGTGNLAGVAVAISLGGPGAIFWMWVVALVGMATAYAESTLAQLYKTHGPNGNYRGGPAFYMARGLNMRWLGVLFSICLVFSFGLIFNSVQANSIAGAMELAFGLPQLLTGVGLAALTGMVIFGGLRSITRVAEIIVPFMAVAYLLVAAWIVVTHLGELPDVFRRIFLGAFGLDQAAGGFVGGMTAALLNGVKRGLFSNEAGMGSAPNIAAAATPVPHHPSSQGFVQALGVFVDTILVCTATAVMIIVSGADQLPDVSGIAMTQAAAAYFMGPLGHTFIAIAILLFAFTTIIACYSYAESAMVFLRLGAKRHLAVLRLAVMAFVLWGSLQSVEVVFNAADMSMGIMAVMNLFAVTMLSGVVIRLTQDYKAQRASGKVPEFHVALHPDLAQGVDGEIWK